MTKHLGKRKSPESDVAPPSPHKKSRERIHQKMKKHLAMRRLSTGQKISHEESRGTVDEEEDRMGEDSSKTLKNYSYVGERERHHVRKDPGNNCCRKSGRGRTRSLRTQLFLSFGTVSVLSLCVVAAIEMAALYTASTNIRRIGRRNLEDRASGEFNSISRYAADIINQKLKQYEGISRLVGLVTKERLVGYPNAPGFAQDANVPFPDIYNSSKNMYPIKADHLVPLEWQMVPNVDADNADEHVQHRIRYYINGVSTEDAFIHFQGSCDPSADPTSPLYYPNCVNATNNNINSGGKVHPTSTFRVIHERVSDYASPLLKALYEYNLDIKSIGIYFANDGAGASVRFPGLHIDGRGSYTSIGCEWMLLPNPYDNSRSIGTLEQVAKCHSAGTMVNMRDFNPLEQDWCRDQALNPDKLISSGPLKGTVTPWVMSFGMSIYDDVTKEFIGCTGADMSIIQFTDKIEDIEVTDSGHLVLIRFDDVGTVVSSAGRDDGVNTTAETKFIVSDLGIGVDQPKLEEIKSFFLTNRSDWDPQESFRFVDAGSPKHFVSVYPVPGVPEMYDPEYRPEFLVLLSISEEEILDDISALDDQLDELLLDQRKLLIVDVFAVLGTLIVTISIVSLYLTVPLGWMNQIGDNIVKTFGFPTTADDENDLLATQSRWYRWSPRTEISQLFREFQAMIEQFSGKGTAKFFKMRLKEVKNPFALHHNFQDLYEEAQSKDSMTCSLSRNHSNPRTGESTGSLMVQQHRWRQRIPLQEQGVRRGSDIALFLHRGRNVNQEDDSLLITNPMIRGESNRDVTNTERSVDDDEELRAGRSALVFWIVALIGAPLFIAMLAASINTILNLHRSFPKLIEIAEDVNISMERTLVFSIAQLRARYASKILAVATRDLYVYARFAGWLLMDGVKTSHSITPVVSTAEVCKNYATTAACPALQGKNPATTCDCAWNDPWGQQCTEYAPGESRLSQRVFFEGLLDDAFPNGDRNSTTFPQNGLTPNSTTFWSDIESVPGADQGLNATGYDYTFGRLRALSAMSAILIPLYNYVQGTDLSRTWSTKMSFEADGIIGGYSGCEFEKHSTFAHSQLLEKNELLNPDLCPSEKYG